MPSTVISARPGRVLAAGAHVAHARIACLRVVRRHMACLRVVRPRPALFAGLAVLMCLGVAPASRAGSGLDPKTAAAGLKEALGVGTSRSVDLLGRQDGYLKNVDVRIPMPEKLHFVEKSLRTIGRGSLVDEFVTSMNRAAETAAPLARSVFLDTIKQMSFEIGRASCRERV